MKALIRFQSNSAARKTLETTLNTFTRPHNPLQIFWMNMDGFVTGKATIEIIGENKGEQK